MQVAVTRIVDSEPETAVQVHTRDGVATFGETWSLQEQGAVAGASSLRPSTHILVNVQP